MLEAVVLEDGVVVCGDEGVVVRGDEDGVVVRGCLQPPLILDPHPHLMIL